MSPNSKYLEKSEIVQFYSGKSVFVTGGTGFLGKALIEKLLYSCKDIDKIYMLVREKKGVHGYDRVSQITNSSIFDRIRNQRPESLKKLVPLVGNICQNDLGLSTEDLNILQEVSVIFHAAASVSLRQTLMDALSINAIGTENVVKLSYRLKKLQSLVYVSTAYCNTDRYRIEEIVYPSPHSLEYALELAKKYPDNKDIPCEVIGNKLNTYAYSKSIAEEIVQSNHGCISTVIIRPSIVTSSVREPFPGWIDNWNGATRVIDGVVKGLARVIPANGHCIVDLIPVDIVTNVTIVAATKCDRKEELKVYNCCTGNGNPVTYSEMLNCVANISADYRLYDIPYPLVFFASNRRMYELLASMFNILPAYTADYFSNLTGKTPTFISRQDKLKNVFGVTTAILNNQWHFSDTNVTKLLDSMSECDKEIFGFDIKSWSWNSYFRDYVFGIQKHLLIKLKSHI